MPQVHFLNVREGDCNVIQHIKFAQKLGVAIAFPPPAHTGYHYLKPVRRIAKLKPPPTMPPIRTQW